MNSPQSADITPNARNPNLASETRKQTRTFALDPPSNSLGGLEQGGWALKKQTDGDAGPFREETEPPMLSHSCSHPGDPSRPSAQHHRDSTRAFGTQEQQARGQPRPPAGNRNSRARVTHLQRGPWLLPGQRSAKAVASGRNQRRATRLGNGAAASDTQPL